MSSRRVPELFDAGGARAIDGGVPGLLDGALELSDPDRVDEFWPNAAFGLTREQAEVAPTVLLFADRQADLEEELEVGGVTVVHVLEDELPADRREPLDHTDHLACAADRIRSQVHLPTDKPVCRRSRLRPHRVA